MKKLLVMLPILLGSLLGHAQMQAIESDLLQILTNAENAQNYYRVRILLADRVNIDSLSAHFDRERPHVHERNRRVVKLLMAKAEATQPLWFQRIEMLEKSMPGSLKYIEPYWITNLLIVEAQPALLLALANQNAGIEAMEEDMDPFMAPDPVVVESTNSPQIPNGSEIGLRISRAPFMWARDYTGRGRLAMVSDNGVWREHPSFASRWRGLFVPPAHTWFGPGTMPTACSNNNNHGTHVLGTMIGLDLNTRDTIGFAVNAQWIAAGSLCAGSGGGTTGAFQWALNPDGDPNTSDDVPDVINNSWGGSQGTTQCNSTVVPVLNALEAAGVAVVFSAGNSGPGASTITAPKNVITNEVNTFCVGNIQGAVSGFPINNSSSRGPSICPTNNQELLIKPEVSAPGTNIRSASTGASGYANLTGTSMAAPHVSGAVLLLKEAFPYLSGSDILRGILYSATDLGPPGEDNTFGMGMMNLEAAFNYLVNQGNVPARPNYGDYNVRAAELISPETIICGDSIQPVISFVNLGDSSISEAKILYRIGTAAYDTLLWLGSLQTDQRDTISLPTLPVPAGQTNFNFSFKIILDTAIAEVDTFDNQKTSLISIRTQDNPPLIERFTSSNLFASKLIPRNPDNSIGWTTISTIGRPTGNRSAYINLFGYSDIGQKDYLETGRLSAPDSGLFVLRFAHAYAQRDSSSNDSLRVSISTDCGDSWTSLWAEGGSNLATSQPIGTIFIPSSNGQWQNNQIDLSAYLGLGEVVLRFESTNANGNNLFLDDIEVLISNMKPLVNFNFITLGGCDSVQVQLLSTVFNADSLHWQSAAFTDTAQNPVIRLAPGIYPVTLYGYNSLGVDSFELSVIIPDAPIANFRVRDSVYNAGRFIGLINQSLFASDYFWDFGDGTTATGFAPQKIYQQQGTYTIRLLSSNANCTDSLILTDVVTIIQGVSVQELAAEQIKLYPNPTTAVLNLNWGELQAQELEIRNPLGQLVYRQQIEVDASAEQLQVGSLPKGMYLLRISGKDFSVVKRFIRE
ncbi:MAG: S8 family serine peptidase [Bacteroidia bacterium]